MGRAKIERELNASMEGYSVSIPKADIQWAGPSVVLYDLALTQDAHPEPAIADVPQIHWGLQWKPLFRGHLLTDLIFEEPI